MANSAHERISALLRLPLLVIQLLIFRVNAWSNFDLQLNNHTTISGVPAIATYNHHITPVSFHQLMLRSPTNRYNLLLTSLESIVQRKFHTPHFHFGVICPDSISHDTRIYFLRNQVAWSINVQKSTSFCIFIPHCCY